MRSSKRKLNSLSYFKSIVDIYVLNNCIQAHRRIACPFFCKTTGLYSPYSCKQRSSELNCGWPAYLVGAYVPLIIASIKNEFMKPDAKFSFMKLFIIIRSAVKTHWREAKSKRDTRVKTWTVSIENSGIKTWKMAHFKQSFKSKFFNVRLLLMNFMDFFFEWPFRIQIVSWLPTVIDQFCTYRRYNFFVKTLLSQVSS